MVAFSVKAAGRPYQRRAGAALHKITTAAAVAVVAGRWVEVSVQAYLGHSAEHLDPSALNLVHQFPAPARPEDSCPVDWD